MNQPAQRHGDRIETMSFARTTDASTNRAHGGGSADRRRRAEMAVRPPALLSRRTWKELWNVRRAISRKPRRPSRLSRCLFSSSRVHIRDRPPSCGARLQCAISRFHGGTPRSALHFPFGSSRVDCLARQTRQDRKVCLWRFFSCCFHTAIIRFARRDMASCSASGIEENGSILVRMHAATSAGTHGGMAIGGRSRIDIP